MVLLDISHSNLQLMAFLDHHRKSRPMRRSHSGGHHNGLDVVVEPASEHAQVARV
jgi:hypothetical protein